MLFFSNWIGHLCIKLLNGKEHSFMTHHNTLYAASPNFLNPTDKRIDPHTLTCFSALCFWSCMYSRKDQRNSVGKKSVCSKRVVPSFGKIRFGNPPGFQVKTSSIRKITRTRVASLHADKEMHKGELKDKNL